VTIRAKYEKNITIQLLPSTAQTQLFSIPLEKSPKADAAFSQEVTSV
jgi:hypothetical protein